TGTAVGQGEWVSSVPGEFYERTALVRSGAADRAGGEQITGAQCCSVGGEVSELLRRGPVVLGEGRLGDGVTVETHGQGDVEPRFRHVLANAGQRLRVAGRRRDPRGVQRGEWHQPRRDRGGG